MAQFHGNAYADYPIYQPEFANMVVPANGTVPFYYSSAPSLLPWLSDKDLSLAAPVVSYWVFSLFFHALDTWGANWAWLQPYRIHESAEITQRNLVSKKIVVAAVVFQHAIQTLMGMLFLEDAPANLADVDHWFKMRKWSPILVQSTLLAMGDPLRAQAFLKIWGPSIMHFVYWWFIPFCQMLWAFFIIDTWQYWFHRTFHVNKFLYRHLHSWHHRLYVPYAFGALYNHPLEGFLLDTVGTIIARYFAGMSTRQDILLFTFATLKTIDDHCGYSLPFDPFQLLFSNNADYHDIHHQTIGIKRNFAQPFFIHWDIIMGTRMTRQDIASAQAKRDKPATNTNGSANGHASGHANGQTNGHGNGQANKRAKPLVEKKAGQ